VSARADLIQQYIDGITELETAVAGLSAEQLDRRAGPDEWTAREIVHHVADSEMTSAIRLRRLLAEDNPVISGYDQEAFAARLHYGARPIGPSLAATRAARESTASILEHLSEAEWSRAGTHTESGAYSVDDWLRIYATHCHDHAAQARRAAGTSGD
jgi:hypothetical protein